jgi:hypothetical protein
MDGIFSKSIPRTYCRPGGFDTPYTPTGALTALTEIGDRVEGVFDSQSLHEIIMTGSQPDGRTFTGNADYTCQNCTSNGSGRPKFGHHDCTSGDPGIHTNGNSSWSSAHPSSDCSQEGFKPFGGAAFFYSLAINCETGYRNVKVASQNAISCSIHLRCAKTQARCRKTR